MAGKESGYELDPDGHGLLIRYTNRYFQRCLQQRLQPTGYTLGQWFVLRIMWKQPRIAQSDLTAQLLMDAPNVTHIVAALVQKGLLRRERNPHDRRKVELVATPKCEALRDELAWIADEINSRAAEEIDLAELEVLHRVLHRMMRNLGEFTP